MTQSPPENTGLALYDFSAQLITGETRSLSDYRGKVVLIVNVASRCGFTPQYAELQTLYQEFKSVGFEILAFPCNQFGAQEAGSNEEIAGFCDRTFGVTFPMFGKINVNGAAAHPLYAWLKHQKGGLLGNSIKWNFTKFLVDRAGTVHRRFAPVVKPHQIAKQLTAIL